MEERMLEVGKSKGTEKIKGGEKDVWGFKCAESRAIDGSSVYIEFLELNNIEGQSPLPTFPTITIDYVHWWCLGYINPNKEVFSRCSSAG